MSMGTSRKGLKESTKAKLQGKLIKAPFHQRWMADNNRAHAASSGSELEVNDVLIQHIFYIQYYYFDSIL